MQPLCFGRPGWTSALLLVAEFAVVFMSDACGQPAIVPGPPSVGRTAGPAPSAAPPTSCRNPAARNYSALVYDSERQKLLLFGGWGVAAYGDTWLWDGTCWQNVIAPTAPSARWAPAADFDPDHHQVVMFGGRTFPDTWLDDTWIWDGSGWTNRRLANHPVIRFPIGAYDPAISKFVVYGLNSDGNPQTWTWDGAAWQLIPTTVSPPARFSSVLAYDAVSHSVILFRWQTDPQFLGRHLDLRWNQLEATDASEFPFRPTGLIGCSY